MSNHTITVAGQNIPVETHDHAQTTRMVLGTAFRWSAYAYCAELGCQRGEGATEAQAIADLQDEMESADPPVRCEECWHYLEECDCDEERADDPETQRADSIGYAEASR